MIHALKYEENKKVGIYLEERVAYEMESFPFFYSIDYIIPVPLHPKKEKLRGYNQSLCIAKGIKEILEIKIDSKSLQRKVNTEAQTKKQI